MSLKAATPTQILLSDLSFPEAPRWHDGKLWFSDFYTNRVMTVDPAGHAETVVEVAGRPSGLGWNNAGELLIVSMLDHRLLKLGANGLETVADLSEHATGPCNDMVVDHLGRAYIGNFGFDRHAGAEPRSACLVRVDPDGTVVRVAEDLLFPNGMVITPDGKTLIVAESMGYRLTAFDIAADGSLGNRRLFASTGTVYPDGICRDAEGAIWVANARGSVLVRIFEGGRIERTINLGDRRSFACMLGGEDGRTLFICTCTDSGPAIMQKRDGRIQTVVVDVPGAGLP